MKYIVYYEEIFNGATEVEAASEQEAIQIVKDKIEADKIEPTKNYDSHEVSVNWAEEDENA